MKKLMISILLVLGMYQTTTPMFAMAKAAIAARMYTPFMQYVAPTVVCTVASYLQFRELQAVNTVFSSPGFQANNGMVEHGWLKSAWETSKWLYSEVGAGIGIAGLLMGGASTAHSLVKGTPSEQQPVTAQSGAIAVPGAKGQAAGITPEMREERHRRNREMLAKMGYNPTVIRANQ